MKPRRLQNLCFVGDSVKIVKGRNMVGSTKVVAKTFTYRVNSHIDVKYLVFTDGSKCNMGNCVNECGNEIWKCYNKVSDYKFYGLGGRKY